MVGEKGSSTAGGTGSGRPPSRATDPSNGGQRAVGAPARAITDLVDAALDSEDVLPLVRVVFESKKLREKPKGDESQRLSRQSSFTGGRAESTDGISRSGQQGGPEVPGVSALDDGDAPEVLASLHAVVEAQEAEIERLCRAHYVDIVRCSQDVASMASPVGTIKDAISDNMSALQQSGAVLLGGVTGVEELTAVKDRLRDAKSAVEACTVGLELCDSAWTHIENNEPYRALKTAQRISHLISGATAATPGGTPAHDTSGLDLRLLKPFVLNQVSEISAAVENSVMDDFKEWLVNVRRMAATIGQEAIRRAAQQRQTEDDIVNWTRALQTALMETRDPRAAAAQCLMSGKSSEAEESEGGMGGLMEGLDMAPLYRAHHIFKTLGKGDWFHTTYMDNRRQQMMTDLAQSQSFVDVYQPYLNQVVGFFLVEDRVLRTSDGITTASSVDGLWESALAQIKVALMGAYDKLGDPNALLLVKDFVHLVCRALASCNFHVTPVEEILANGRNKYHDLLLSNATREYITIIKRDDLQSKTKVEKEKDRDQLLENGLPVSLMEVEGPGESAEPALPFTVPFTPMVMDLLRLTKRYIADSAAYLRGIMGPGEVLHAVRQFRDRVISKGLCEGLASCMARDGQSLPMSGLLQMIVNIWALTHSLSALDEYTISEGRISKAQRGPKAAGGQSLAASFKSTASKSIVSSSESAASLKALLSGAQAQLVAEMSRQLEHLLGSAITSFKWMAESPPSSKKICSEYMEKAVAFVEKHMDQAAQLLPSLLCLKLKRDTIRAFAQALTGVLTAEAVSKYNIYGMQRLSRDLKVAEECTARITGSADPGHEFGMIRALVDVLLSNEVGRLTEGGAVPEKYESLLASPQQASTAALILDKYRESSTSLWKSSASQAFPRKKEVDLLVKYLRDLSRGIKP